MTHCYKFMRLVVLVCIGLFCINASADPAVDQTMLQTILEKDIQRLQKIVTNEILVNAVKEQNAQGQKLAEIQEKDALWKGSDDTAPLKTTMLSTDASQYLKQLITHQGRLYNEAFLTDDQGANVATFPLTSDYWQGDETKWSASFANGEGIVYVGDIELDESTNTKAVQISVPVKDGDQTIGVMVVGVKLSHVLSKQLSDARK